MRNRILLGVGVAGLALLLAAEPALAQRGGRGGGGRGFSGGRSFVGGRGFYSGGRAYYGGRGYYGGWGRGYYGGWGLGYPYYGVGVYGYPYYGGYYGSSYYPYATGYAASPDYYGTPTYSTSGPAYVANDTSTYQSFYSGPQGNPNSAQIRVTVPNPNAQVLFDGNPTRQGGTDRVFVTPPLNPDKESHYTVTATWTENGQSVTRERRVSVRPGARLQVDFTRPDAGDMPSVPD